MDAPQTPVLSRQVTEKTAMFEPCCPPATAAATAAHVCAPCACEPEHVYSVALMFMLGSPAAAPAASAAAAAAATPPVLRKSDAQDMAGSESVASADVA